MKSIHNGVDVSDCGFYHAETGEDCHIALAFGEEYTDAEHTYFKCEQHPNCMYKKLAKIKELCNSADFSYLCPDCSERLASGECGSACNAYILNQIRLEVSRGL